MAGGFLDGYRACRNVRLYSLAIPRSAGDIPAADDENVHGYNIVPAARKTTFDALAKRVDVSDHTTRPVVPEVVDVPKPHPFEPESVPQHCVAETK